VPRAAEPARQTGRILDGGGPSTLQGASGSPKAPAMSSLSSRQRRILRAVIAAIRPRGHGFDQPIDEHVLREVEAFLPYLPLLLRRGLPLGLHLVEWGPPLFARRWCRFSSMTAEDGGRYLAGWQEAGGLRGALLLGLRTLVFLAFYQHPEVLARLEVDWAGRARALVRRRAELLADERAA
jgi:hypothetical protein